MLFQSQERNRQGRRDCYVPQPVFSRRMGQPPSNAAGVAVHSKELHVDVRNMYRDHAAIHTAYVCVHTCMCPYIATYLCIVTSILACVHDIQGGLDECINQASVRSCR